MTTNHVEIAIGTEVDIVVNGVQTDHGTVTDVRTPAGFPQLVILDGNKSRAYATKHCKSLAAA